MEKLIDNIGNKDIVKLLNSAIEWRFHRIDKLRFIKRIAKQLPIVIFVKIAKPISAENVNVSDNVTILPMCKLRYIYSYGLLFGYFIEAPKISIRIERNHVVLVRHEAKELENFSGTELSFQNAHLNVFHSPDGASVITFNEHNLFLSNEIIKEGV